MKAVVILGSPRRKKSASYKIAERLIRGMKKNGADVDEIFLVDKNINPCIGCYTCWTKTPGQCVHKDDMVEILEKIRNADLVIHSTPLYYYDVTGIFKNFTDRQLPLVQPYLVARGDTTGHPIRGDKPHPKVFLISVCGFPERSHFDPLLKRYEKVYGSTIGDLFAGHFLLPGSEPLARGSDQLFTEILSLAEKTGQELAENLKISKDTAEKIVQATTSTKEEVKMFLETANQYWKSLQPREGAVKPKSIEHRIEQKPLSISSGGMDTFFAGMALQYVPSKAASSNGVIQFDLDDKNWFIVMDGKKASAYSGKHPNPDMTVISPLKLWMDISEGCANGEAEFLKGAYKIEGDMSYLMNMDKTFNTSSGDKPEDAMSDLSNEKSIPDKRGFINLSGMTWMQVAFVPWIVVWVFGSMFPGLVPRFVAAGLSLLVLLYHSMTNRPTLFEFGSTAYLVVMSVLLSLNLNFVGMYIWVIDYVFLGALWLGSSINRFSLTAEYSGQGFSKSVLMSNAFLVTNIIISSVWGLFFLLEALIMLVEMSYPKIAIALMIVRYVLLVPMFVFTNWFQKWYPEKILLRK